MATVKQLHYTFNDLQGCPSCGIMSHIDGMGGPKMGGGGESAAKVVGIEGQQTFMDHFSAHGLQNPKRTVTSKGFHK